MAGSGCPPCWCRSARRATGGHSVSGNGARADAAEARAEELRWAEVAARSDGGSWKSRFKACRRRLSEAVEETKEARRTARDVPSLQAEVARLETLLSEAGIASAFDTAGALRKENARLRKALAASKAREGATGPWPRSAPAAHRPGELVPHCWTAWQRS